MFEYKVWIGERNFLYIVTAINEDKAMKLMKRKFPEATLIEKYIK